MEAAFFLKSMGQVRKVKHDKPKVAGPTPLEVAQLEDNLAMAELASLIGQDQSWAIEVDEDQVYTDRKSVV